MALHGVSYGVGHEDTFEWMMCGRGASSAASFDVGTSRQLRSGAGARAENRQKVRDARLFSRIEPNIGIGVSDGAFDLLGNSIKIFENKNGSLR